MRVALCAPTGRAAKRMEELTGHAASTIHRLLEARGVPGEGFTFGYDSQRRLPHDIVIADEWSMADPRLAGALPPSALETFAQCSLKFFFDRVLGLRALEEPEDLPSISGWIAGRSCTRSSSGR
ncbi:MAG: AAA family ATPase [Actinobacteria bacterium]|nr:AAA family ATPase [Actinomycetota bacterium]